MKKIIIFLTIILLSLNINSQIVSNFEIDASHSCKYKTSYYRESVSIGYEFYNFSIGVGIAQTEFYLPNNTYAIFTSPICKLVITKDNIISSYNIIILNKEIINQLSISYLLKNNYFFIGIFVNTLTCGIMINMKM